MMNGAGPLQVAAQVVEMSDLEAFAAGVAENMKRNDMSPVHHADHRRHDGRVWDVRPRLARS